MSFLQLELEVDPLVEPLVEPLRTLEPDTVEHPPLLLLLLLLSSLPCEPLSPSWLHLPGGVDVDVDPAELPPEYVQPFEAQFACESEPCPFEPLVEPLVEPLEEPLVEPLPLIELLPLSEPLVEPLSELLVALLEDVAPFERSPLNETPWSSAESGDPGMRSGEQDATVRTSAPAAAANARPAFIAGTRRWRVGEVQPIRARSCKRLGLSIAG